MQDQPSTLAIIIAFLKSPWTLFASVLLGVASGIFAPAFAFYFAPFGKVYLTLLQMCILPLMIAAIVSSLGKLLLEGKAGKSLGRIFLFFLAGLTGVAIITIAVAVYTEPGSQMSEQARMVIGELLSSTEMSHTAENPSGFGVVDFIHMMIPLNPFEAVVQGRNLPVVFFSILFGLALGLVRTESGRTAVAVAEALYDAFLRIIDWVLCLLPFGLWSLFADQLRGLGIDILVALIYLIIASYVIISVVFAVQISIISWRLKVSPYRVLLSLRRTFLVALGSSSSFATLPVVMKDLEQRLHVDKKPVNLVVPLGISLNPQGTSLYFLIVTLFMANLFDVHLNIDGYFVAGLSSMLAGMSITGVPAIAGLSMLSIVMSPLGLPTEAAIILVLAINPLIEPLITVINITGHSMTAILVATTGSGKKITTAETPSSQEGRLKLVS